MLSFDDTSLSEVLPGCLWIKSDCKTIPVLTHFMQMSSRKQKRQKWYSKMHAKIPDGDLGNTMSKRLRSQETEKIIKVL